MSERWHRAASRNEVLMDVWVCLREMYSSILVCVANRSDHKRRIVMDASRCKDVVLLCEMGCRVTEHSSEQVLEPGTTLVVAVLNGVAGRLPSEVDVRVAAFEHIDSIHTNVTGLVDVTALKESIATSAQVASWLAARDAR
jgi:hypothetical protein